VKDELELELVKEGRAVIGRSERQLPVAAVTANLSKGFIEGQAVSGGR
jgi:hypothetical protein